MTRPNQVLLVRFKSSLSLDEVVSVIETRIGEFRALAGLTQKYYLQDADTGEYAGLYLWDGPESLQSFLDSDLKATIAKAYQVEGAPRAEVYQVMKILREDGHG